MRDTLKRRFDLLKLEEKGFTRSEIGKALVKQYNVTPRTVRYDFQKRHEWQPNLQGYDDQKQLLLSTVSTLTGLLKESQFKAYRDKEIPDTVRVAWAKLVNDTAVKIYELLYPSRLQHDLFIKTDKSANLSEQIDFNALSKKEQKALMKAEEVLHKDERREVNVVSTE